MRVHAFAYLCIHTVAPVHTPIINPEMIKDSKAYNFAMSHRDSGGRRGEAGESGSAGRERTGSEKSSKET